MMNRREFVVTVTSLSLAAGAGLGGLALRRRVAVDGAAEDFRDLQGVNVCLTADDGSVAKGRVAEVRTTTTPRRPNAPATEQISVTVDAAGGGCAGGVYRMDGEDVSVEGLYFSPVGPDGPERRLEAVITRIV